MENNLFLSGYEKPLFKGKYLFKEGNKPAYVFFIKSELVIVRPGKPGRLRDIPLRSLARCREVLLQESYADSARSF